MTTEQQKKGRKNIIIFVLILVIGSILNKYYDSKHPSINYGTRTPNHRHRGDSFSTKSQIFGGVTEDALDELIRLSSKNDTKGISNMVLMGQVVIIPPGTPIKIIDKGVFTSTIRAERANFYEGALFVPSEFIDE